MGSAGLSQVTTAQAQDDTSGNADLLPGAAAEERFEVARRGYDRRQVEEFVARSRREAVGMRNRLVKALREAEQLRVDLAAARQAAWEAAAQKDRVARELAALRTQAEMALARNLWWPSPPQDEDVTAC
jgi:cell division septum initiation protein DivIVA